MHDFNDTLFQVPYNQVCQKCLMNYQVGSNELYPNQLYVNTLWNPKLDSLVLCLDGLYSFYANVQDLTKDKLQRI